MLLDINDLHTGMFQKDKLDELLKIHGVSRDQILRETLGKNPKQFANWKVKWSRLINKKEKDPGNFGLMELSNLLATYFNSRGKVDQKILSTTYFITRDAVIYGLGQLLANGQVLKHKKKSKLRVYEKWAGYQFIEQKNAHNHHVRYFKPLTMRQTDSMHNMSVILQKKTGILYVGYLKPLSNGNYNVEDRSRIDGDKIKDIATNIDVQAASKIEASSIPYDSQWVL